MLTLTHHLPPDPTRSAALTLALTAEERTRSRHCFETPEGQIYLRLPRGTVLHHNDLLRSEVPETWVRVIAKPEPVMVVTASTPLALLRAAYHLGNRHVPLEITPDYLQFAADPVLKAMLQQLGVQVREAVLPFQPEAGAYGQSQGHSHDHQHSPSDRTQQHREPSEVAHSHKQDYHSHYAASSPDRMPDHSHSS